MKLGLAIAIVALSTEAAFPAEALRLEGAAVKTDASISWGSITNHLPQTVQIYKVLPQTLSKTVMAKAMEIAGFTPLKMKMSADKKTMQWQFRDAKETLQRGLEICPARGWISLFNYQTEQTGSIQSVGVPTFDRVDELALQYLKQLGGDTNQLSFHPRYCTDKKRSVYVRKNGQELFDDVTMRGCMYSRELDGISFIGKSTCGGLWVEFGNHEKVARLNLLWRNLQPDKKYRLASFKQMTKFIQNGMATCPEQNFDPQSIASAKRITVTGVILHYSGETGDLDSSVAIPFAELYTKVTLEDSTSADCALFCPVLAEAIEKK
jgi:hypothetical protein